MYCSFTTTALNKDCGTWSHAVVSSCKFTTLLFHQRRHHCLCVLQLNSVRAFVHVLGSRFHCESSPVTIVHSSVLESRVSYGCHCDGAHNSDENPTIQHISFNYTEPKNGADSIFLRSWVQQICLSTSQRTSSRAYWTYRKKCSKQWCLSSSMRAWKIVRHFPNNLLPDSSSLSRGWPSSSVTSWRQRVGFLARQDRSPNLHFVRHWLFPSVSRGCDIFMHLGL